VKQAIRVEEKVALQPFDQDAGEERAEDERGQP
jgi:hypothetical protein